MHTGRDEKRILPVSVMIFTLNEEVNLPGCLESLKWCDDIIVVDSFSTDRTEGICRAASANFFQHEFKGFGRQRNWAIDHTSAKHDWIFMLDADERVPAELVDELLEILPSAPESVGAYRLRRRFHMWDRWLRYSSLYPTWVVRLIRKDRVRYINRGHAETQEVQGEIRDLRNDLIDENRKGIDEWFERQNRYSTKEAQYEMEEGESSVNILNILSADPLVRRAAIKHLVSCIPGRPIFYFFYSYIVRKGFLDGKDGLMFCYMKSLYQSMIGIKKYDLRRKRRGK
jgi:glycosyltransferase involved in cell wall biosynthesis